MGRYVNHLEEEDFGKKEIRNTLKALREWALCRGLG